MYKCGNVRVVACICSQTISEVKSDLGCEISAYISMCSFLACADLCICTSDFFDHPPVVAMRFSSFQTLRSQQVSNVLGREGRSTFNKGL